jgi:hypothetical protein
MSEDHICFRMLCFNVNQAQFLVSAENFVKVLFFMYDFVCSYEQDRLHVAACEGFTQYLQPDKGLHLSPDPLHVCGGVPTRQRGPVHKVHRQRCKQGHEPPSTAMFMPQYTRALHFSPVATHHTSVCSVHNIMDDEAPSFVVLCAAHAAKIPNYSTTCDRNFYSS